MPNGRSRRAARRVPVDIPAGYVQNTRQRGITRIIELSAGGCILGQTFLDARGTEVFLHFRLQGTQAAVEIELRGRVVRVTTGVGTALEFISVTPDIRQRLHAYVESVAAGQSAAPAAPGS